MRRALPLLLLVLFALSACSAYVSVGWDWGPDYPWCCYWAYDVATWRVGDDPWPDLLVASDDGELYRVAFSPGRGFADAPDLLADLGDGGRRVATGDLDGDGRGDVVAVDPASGLLEAWLGDGNGGLAVAPAGVTNLPVSSDVVGLRLARLDADDRADLVVQEADGTVQALRGQGDGAFTGATLVASLAVVGPLSGAPEVLAPAVPLVLGSFDLDPGLDLIAVDEVGIRFFSGVGDGSFGMGDGSALDVPGIVVFDAAALPSGDGAPADLVVLAGFSPTGPAVLVHYANLGDGHFSRRETVPAGGARRITVFQLGNDARPDLLLLDPRTESFRILVSRTR